MSFIMTTYHLQDSIGIIGSGCAGLITAQTLLRDGFSNVQILTRDETVGGVWAEERVYPGLTINNVHGEFRFSSLPMPPSSGSATNGGRLTGYDMRRYMQEFADTFLHGHIRFSTLVQQLRRVDGSTRPWHIEVENLGDGSKEVLMFDRIVLCTGGCSAPNIPTFLSMSSALESGFKGPVIHSSEFAARMDDVLAAVPAIGTSEKKADVLPVVVVGGGKSAQDMASFMANEGRRVIVVFETADTFLASPIPLPAFIRKSRVLSVLSSYSELRTRLERLLHTTWIGSKIVHGFWNLLSKASLSALSVPGDSPLRRSHSLFWSLRTNDEGIPRPNSFHSLVNSGKIELISPARVIGYVEDGSGVRVRTSTGERGDILEVVVGAVILATGFTSSWDGLFDASTAESIGIDRHPPIPQKVAKDEWSYASLASPPPSHPESQQWASSIYQGLVPAKNIAMRDFAINGAVFTSNNGYTCEVISHWISSYFLNDSMRLPSSPEAALAHAEKNARWMRKRFPDQLLWMNESYSAAFNLWTWPQYVDTLLEDMGLRSGRSGGNWFTWPFKVIDVNEIATLREERRDRRESSNS